MKIRSQRPSFVWGDQKWLDECTDGVSIVWGLENVIYGADFKNEISGTFFYEK